jgi:Protein of unknown function (DUF3592)
MGDWFPLAIAGIGVFSALRGIWSMLAARRFESRGARVSATVTDMRERYVHGSGNSGSTRVWVPVVRFATGDGRTVEAETSGYKHFRRQEAGDSIEVVYDPADPTDVRLPAGVSSSMSSVASIAAGLVIAWFALAIFGGFDALGL